MKNVRMAASCITKHLTIGFGPGGYDIFLRFLFWPAIVACGAGLVGTDCLAGLAKPGRAGAFAKNAFDYSAMPNCSNPCFVAGSPDSYQEKSASYIDCGN